MSLTLSNAKNIATVLTEALPYIQKFTGWIGLNPEAYYLSEVPVQVDFGFLLLVETLVFCLCVAMMFIPALASTRIRPAEALRMTG